MDDVSLPHSFIQVTARTPPARIPPPSTARPGGLGLGAIVMSALNDAGVTMAGVRWVYSPGISRDEFPPHRALAGRFFEALPAEDRWYPGDHKGCLCHDQPVLRGPQGRFIARDALNPPDRVDRG